MALVGIYGNAEVRQLSCGCVIQQLQRGKVSLHDAGIVREGLATLPL